MPFKDLMGKAQEVAGAATDIAGRFLDEFNEALPAMRALGFTVKDLHVGMGLPPETLVKLVASIDTVDVKKVQEIIDKNAENKTLVALLKTLQAAYHIKQQLGDVAFKGVEMDITLGLPPHVSVGFVSHTASPAGFATTGAA